MSTRLENLALSGLVALAVSVSVSAADTSPGMTFKGAKAPGQPAINTQPGSSPSASDVNRAQSREIRSLKNDVALLKQNLNIVVDALNTTNQDVADLQNEMPCFDSGYQAAWDSTGHLVANNDEPNPSNFIINVTGAECGG